MMFYLLHRKNIGSNNYNNNDKSTKVCFYIIGGVLFLVFVIILI